MWKISYSFCKGKRKKKNRACGYSGKLEFGQIEIRANGNTGKSVVKAGKRWIFWLQQFPYKMYYIVILLSTFIMFCIYTRMYAVFGKLHHNNIKTIHRWKKMSPAKRRRTKKNKNKNKTENNFQIFLCRKLK